MRSRQLDSRCLLALRISLILLTLAALDANAGTWINMNVKFVRLESRHIVVQYIDTKSNICFKRETLGPPVVYKIWRYAKDKPKVFLLPGDAAVYPEVDRKGKEKCPA
jgi:hypothetical protein